jgi:hypothetical protein
MAKMQMRQAIPARTVKPAVMVVLAVPVVSVAWRVLRVVRLVMRARWVLMVMAVTVA